MSKRIAGVAYVKYDGKQLSLAGSLTVSPNKVSREGLAGLSGVAGYSENPRVPYVEGDFYLTENLSLAEIERITNATVTAELANGKIYTLKQAWKAGDIEANAAEGTTTIRFEGIDCIEG